MKKKILLIEDSVTTTNVLTMRLEGNDYAVISAADGETGLMKMKKERPDLVILDVQLPGIDGFEVCRQAKQDPLLKTTPIIFLTIRAQKTDLDKAKQVGGNGYITKPYDWEEVQGAIEKALK